MTRKNLFMLAGFFAAMAAGCFLRLAALGRAPLTDAEARLALQALSIVKGQPTTLDSQAAYLVLTTVGTFFWGATEFTARLWPALFGCFLLFVPYLLRRRLGWPVALILTWGLAFDPGLIGISTQANGAMIALAALALALACWLSGHKAWAGFWAAWALMGGPAIWQGVLLLAAAYGVTWLLQRGQQMPWRWPSEAELRPAWITGGVTLLLGAGLFGFIPYGWGAFAGSLFEYGRGWLAGGGESPLLLSASWLAYEFFVLILFAAWFIRHVRHFQPLERFGFWLVILGSLFGLLNPARQMVDWGWVLLPLWGMAAFELWQVMQHPVEERWTIMGQMLLMLVLFTFAWLNLAGMLNLGGFTLGQVRMEGGTPVLAGESEQVLRLAGTLGALFLVVSSTLLIAWGWSQLVALKGLAWGCLAFLCVFSITTGGRAASLGVRPEMETWRAGAYPLEADLLMQTVHDLSRWNSKGEPEGLDVVVLNQTSPALQWALRSMRNVRYLNALPLDNKPSLILTPEIGELSAATQYRGQDFVWEYRPTPWASLDELGRWLGFRYSPAQQKLVILWARADLFSGQASVKNEK